MLPSSVLSTSAWGHERRRERVDVTSGQPPTAADAAISRAAEIRGQQGDIWVPQRPCVVGRSAIWYRQLSVSAHLER